MSHTKRKSGMKYDAPSKLWYTPPPPSPMAQAGSILQQEEDQHGPFIVHLHSGDVRFCGDSTPARGFSPVDSHVTCPACRKNMSTESGS